MTVRTHRTYTYDHKGVELELVSEAIEDSIIVKKTKQGYKVGFLTYDEDCENPEEMDGFGKIGTSSRSDSPGANEIYQQALGLTCNWEKDEDAERNPDAVTLDVYEHGNRVYHIGYNHNFPDRQWDCAYGGAIWVPDDSLREEVKGLSEKARKAKMTEFAEQAVETMNEWMNGGCYVVWTQNNDKDGTLIDDDNVGGFIGRKWAEEELKGMMK